MVKRREDDGTELLQCTACFRYIIYIPTNAPAFRELVIPSLDDQKEIRHYIDRFNLPDFEKYVQKGIIKEAEDVH